VSLLAYQLIESLFAKQLLHHVPFLVITKLVAQMKSLLDLGARAVLGIVCNERQAKKPVTQGKIGIASDHRLVQSDRTTWLIAQYVGATEEKDHFLPRRTEFEGLPAEHSCLSEITLVDVQAQAVVNIV